MGKNRAAVWPFAVASVAMMLAPSAFTQRTRLTILLGFAPLRSLADASRGLAARTWDRVRPSRPGEELRRQNEFLRSQVVTLHARNGELAAKLESATAARAVVSDDDFELVPADIVLGLDTSSFRQTLVIARGSRDGVKPGMPVLHHSHVVGRVLEAGPWTSRVMLVTDPGFRAGAVSVPRTGDAAVARRDVGVFEGTGGKGGTLKWLSGETPVEDGAYVVTSEDPVNGVPKGLILGRVTGVDRGRGAFPRVDVTPVVNPQGLEFVLILKARR
ncbi:MAG: rod shape-determining protein MreC [Planctomycetes bacterium]|nr:rod shape-determining protein MreC [Planctomycetota bacterium]